MHAAGLEARTAPAHTAAPTTGLRSPSDRQLRARSEKAEWPGRHAVQRDRPGPWGGGGAGARLKEAELSVRDSKCWRSGQWGGPRLLGAWTRPCRPPGPLRVWELVGLGPLAGFRKVPNSTRPQTARLERRLDHPLHQNEGWSRTFLGWQQWVNLTSRGGGLATWSRRLDPLLKEASVKRPARLPRAGTELGKVGPRTGTSCRWEEGLPPRGPLAKQLPAAPGKPGQALRAPRWETNWAGPREGRAGRARENPDSHAAGLPSRLGCPPLLPGTCCSDRWAAAFQAFAFQRELENIPEQLNIAPVKLFHLHACVHSTNTLRGPVRCQMRTDQRPGRSEGRKAAPARGAGAGVQPGSGAAGHSAG